MSEKDNAIRFLYTNYKGETTIRRAIPRGVRYTATEHHPEPQWIMVMWCLDRDAIREFALKDCDFTTTELP